MIFDFTSYHLEQLQSLQHSFHLLQNLLLLEISFVAQSIRL